jgi:hypothetical protein
MDMAVILRIIKINFESHGVIMECDLHQPPPTPKSKSTFDSTNE